MFDLLIEPHSYGGKLMSSHGATPLLAAGVKGGDLGIDGRGVKDDWKRSLIIGSTSRF